MKTALEVALIWAWLVAATLGLMWAAGALI